VTTGFGMLSILAPLANALVGALVSVALILGLTGVVVSSVLPAVGAIAVRLAATVLSGTAWTAGVMAGLPGAAVALSGGPWLSLACVGAAVALWAWWPLPKRRRSGQVVLAVVLSCSVAVALGPAPPRESTVRVLDVGQGDAVLVRDSGRSMLIDAGPGALPMRQALARVGLRRADVVVLTHAHDDHTAGMAALSTVVDVGWVGVPRIAGETDAHRSWGGWSGETRPLAAGDAWMVGSTQVTVLWPPREPTSDLKTNDTSVVLLLRKGRFEMVLTGDAEEAAQQGMLAEGRIGRIDVLKVPHHGSSNGLTAEALGSWAPRYALISVGAGNDFGHPSASTLALLADRRVCSMRTDTCGDIEVAIGEHGYRVSASRRGGVPSVRARMGVAVRGECDRLDSTLPIAKVERGSQQDRGAQTRLSHLWRRGVASGARAPPFARPCGRSRRPRLQL
jgi:competence protein ComEC